MSHDLNDYQIWQAQPADFWENDHKMRQIVINVDSLLYKLTDSPPNNNLRLELGDKSKL